jgi:hypothetical protein
MPHGSGSTHIRLYPGEFVTKLEKYFGASISGSSWDYLIKKNRGRNFHEDCSMLDKNNFM